MKLIKEMIRYVSCHGTQQTREETRKKKILKELFSSPEER